jgi:hypothetical protein
MTRLSLPLAAALAVPLAAAGAQPAVRKDAAAPPATAAATSAAITEADLRARLFAFAHDSLAGRAAGTEEHRRATAYIASELRRLGLRPAGDSGTFLQALPFVRYRVAADARLTLGDSSYAPYDDFVPVRASAAPRSTDGAELVFGGTLGAADDSLLAPDAARGRVVVLVPPPNAMGVSQAQLGAALRRFAEAAGVAVLDSYSPPPGTVSTLRQGQLTLDNRPPDAPAPQETPLLIAMGPRPSQALRAAATSRPGEPPRVGASLGVARGDVRPRAEPSPSYNVVAVLPGRDRALAGTYVALGAHSDHDAPRGRPVDHDSLRAFNQGLVDAGADDPFSASREQRAAVRVNVDSLHRARPARPDSILNGADDDGSGSMALLEIAEQFATAREKPRRSVLFVWHTAEELGMVGSRWYTDHPTVPLDSIVTQINLDMIGRGGARDVAKLGGPGYMQLIGTRRLSTELGDLVEQTNTEGRHGFTFDYQFDAAGHPQQYYCRSDHYMYARFGIPIAFMSTGGHADYHQVTDEPQYIDYPKYTRVVRFIADVTRRVADLDHRPVVDKPKPDPNGQCVQ